MKFDFSEVLKRVIKYLIEGLVVATAAFLIPKKTPGLEEILVLALVAAASFAILDCFIPSMGSSIRNGAGLGLGLNLVKFPM